MARRPGPGPRRRPPPGPLVLVRAAAAQRAERLHRLVETTLAPGGVRALATWRPFSLAAFRLVRSLRDDGWVFATVVDAGANAGQFARASLGVWPGVRVVAFEPLVDVAAELVETVGRLGQVEVHAVALGSRDGSTPFFRHEHSLSSSVYGVVDELRDQAWATASAPVDVPLRRLDTMLTAQDLKRPALLKLDVQGSELEVLAGAQDTLAHVDVVLVEVAFQTFYEGQPHFSAVHAMLAELGWRLARPLDFQRDSDGCIREADWMFVKDPDR